VAEVGVSGDDGSGCDLVALRGVGLWHLHTSDAKAGGAWVSRFENPMNWLSGVLRMAVQQRDSAVGLGCHGPCEERTVRASQSRS
jgi:hypothetical protein